MLIFGTKPKFLLLGTMVSTWFLSMWISNTVNNTPLTLYASHAVNPELCSYSVCLGTLLELSLLSSLICI
jgi:sodium-dependent dicarboxylate transporter 2/3/5